MSIIKNVYLIGIQPWTHLYIKWINVNSDSWHCIFMALLTVTKLLVSILESSYLIRRSFTPNPY